MRRHLHTACLGRAATVAHARRAVQPRPARRGRAPAHARAEREEAAVCRKASSRMIYLNLAVNAIKRLRGEAAKPAKIDLG